MPSPTSLTDDYAKLGIRNIGAAMAMFVERTPVRVSKRHKKKMRWTNAVYRMRSGAKQPPQYSAVSREDKTIKVRVGAMFIAPDSLLLYVSTLTGVVIWRRTIEHIGLIGAGLIDRLSSEAGQQSKPRRSK